MINTLPAAERYTVEQFISTLSYDAIRAVDRPHDTRLPDGRVLRGIEFNERLYLARDRKWYKSDLSNQAHPVSLDYVLRFVSPQTIYTRLADAERKARERRKAYRRARRRRGRP